LGAVEADVPLALLLGIVEGMRVEERPDELAADVFKAEFEVGVLGRRCDGRCRNVAAPMLRRCLSVISSGPIRRGA